MIKIIILFTIITSTLYSRESGAGQIALSFDDAPLGSGGLMTSEEKTDLLIKALKSSNVNSAIFYVTTSNIKDDASVRRLHKYTDAGFSLGNHSHSHRSANKVEPNEYLLDFYKSHLLMSELDNQEKLHRFPFLHYGENSSDRAIIQKGLNELDYKIGYVTVDNYDWYLNSKLIEASNNDLNIDFEKLKKLYLDVLWSAIEFYDRMAIEHLGRSPKHILLLHENEIAALFIDDLVNLIRNNGWEIISPREAYEDPIASLYNPGFTFNKQGRIAAISASKGAKVETLRHPAENTDYLDSMIVKYGIFSKK